MKQLLKNMILFCTGGIVYIVIELLWRGYSHWTMFLLAGFLTVFFIDTPNNIYSFELGYIWQVLISTVFCTMAEGICGLIVNKWLMWGIWDYSNLWGTFFYGQCNVFFVFAWVLIVGLLGIPLCDAYNYYICKIEPCPYYKFRGKVFFKMKEREG